MNRLKLLIESATAQVVREIFEKYVGLGCVSKLKAHLDSRQIHGKQGKPFSRGALYHILNNRVYLGEIVHRKHAYPGTHASIIDPALWDKVAAKLKTNNPAPERHPRVTESSMPAGLVFDAAGIRYTPTHSVKKGKRYRYYTSQSALQRREPAGLARIPAGELESVVEGRLRALLTSPQELIGTLGIDRQKDLKSLAQVRAKQWARQHRSAMTQTVKVLLKRVIVMADCIEIEVSHDKLLASLTEMGPSPPKSRRGSIRLQCAIQVRALGGQTLILSDPNESDRQPRSLSLIKAIVRARDWYEKIVCGDARGFEELAKQNSVTPRYIRRIFRCATLSPELVDAVTGSLPTRLTFESLRRPLPRDWAEQRVFVLGE